jgi:hypothetical protein
MSASLRRPQVEKTIKIHGELLGKLLSALEWRMVF